jgi:hypothetical protein
VIIDRVLTGQGSDGELRNEAEQVDPRGDEDAPESVMKSDWICRPENASVPGADFVNQVWQ